MRLLMLFTIGFCAGSSFCAYIAWNQSALWSLVAALSFFLFLICLLIRRRPALIASVCLLGLSVSMLWFWGYDSLYLSAARCMDGVTVNTKIQVEDYSYSTGYGIAADGSMTLDGKSYKVRLYLDDDAELKPGDWVQGEFRLRYTAAGGQNGSSFHQGDGIFLLAYGQGEHIILPGSAGSASYFPAKLRNQVLGVIREIFPEDTSSFACALLLGDDSGLTYEENTALKLSGIRHVVAVSGQHLVILLAAIMLLSGRSRRIACYISIPVTILFAAMVGFTPSILRACIMQLIMLGAFLSKRDYDGLTALSFAVLLMVASNPLAITSVSLQLSAGSVLGMFLYSGGIYRRIRGWYFFRNVYKHPLTESLLRWVIGSVSVTLGAMVITLPLSAIYFRTVSLIGILTNLLTLWLITFVFYGIIAAAGIGAVWSGAGMLFGKILSVPIRFVVAVAKELSGVPGGCLYLRNGYIIVASILAYAVLLLMLNYKRARVWICVCLITCILFLGQVFAWMQPLQDNWRVTMLDVGQGQCILLQSGARTYMVDCGGDYDEGTADIAAETLLSMGISRIDGLIITHFDADHVCGAAYLLSRIRVDTLMLPEDPENDTYNALPDLCTGRVITVNQDIAFSWDTAQMTVFAGNGGDYGNEMSLCVLFQSGNCDILITGDRPVRTELALLFHRDIPELEYLVAGHHGADTSTSNALLNRLKPKTVLISVGKNNRNGHPAPNLLARLKMHGCNILRTDLQGTITIRG